MSGTAVVDTGVLVDAMVPEARRHSAARNEISALDRMILPSIVVYELVWVLKRLGSSEKTVGDVVEALVGNPKVTVLPDDGQLAMKAMRRLAIEGQDLSSFDDKVILECALKANARLITYDLELKREAKNAGIQD